MGFVTQQIVEHPPWDANTDEQIHAFLGAATWEYVVPENCFYVIFSGDAAAAAIFTSPNASDTDSGILWNNNVGNVRLAMHVIPGTAIQHHGTAVVNLNCLQFYNTPT